MKNAKFKIKGIKEVKEFIAVHKKTQRVTAQKAIFNGKDIFSDKYRDRKFLLEVCEEDNNYIFISVYEDNSTNDYQLTKEDMDKLVNTFILNNDSHYGLDAKQILSNSEFESAFDNIQEVYYLVTADTKNTLERFSELLGEEDNKTLDIPKTFMSIFDDLDDEEEDIDLDEEEEEDDEVYTRDESLYADAVSDNYYETFLGDSVAGDLKKNLEYNKNNLIKEKAELINNISDAKFRIQEDNNLIEKLTSELETVEGRLDYMVEDSPKNGYYVSMIHTDTMSTMDESTEKIIRDNLERFSGQLNIDGMMNQMKSDVYAIVIGEDKMGSDGSEFVITNPRELPPEIMGVLKNNIITGDIIGFGEDVEKGLYFMRFTFDKEYNKLYDKIVKGGFLKSPHFDSYCRELLDINIDEDGEAVTF